MLLANVHTDVRVGLKGALHLHQGIYRMGQPSHFRLTRRRVEREPGTPKSPRAFDVWCYTIGDRCWLATVVFLTPEFEKYEKFRTLWASLADVHNKRRWCGLVNGINGRFCT